MPTRFKLPSEPSVARRNGDPDFEDRFVSSYLRNIDAQFSMPRIEQLGPGSFAGPCRFLEYRQPVDVWHQYSAFEEHEGRQPASLATFMKVYKKIFGTYLKYRDRTEHAQCNSCALLRRKIKESSSRADRLAQVREYSMHILHQWMDRQVYWKLRALSQRFFQAEITHIPRQLAGDNLYSSVITVICDGMDQSKLRVPRIVGRHSKILEQLFRPTLHLSAIWVHGWRLYLPIADESLKKDSQTQLETLARALSELCVAKGLALGLHFQQDNCFREGKNQYMLCFCLSLVLFGCVRWSSCGYLRTGHSHEDVDQVFGCLSRLLRGKGFNDPAQLIQLLQTAARPGEARQIHGTQLTAYKLDQTACWKNFTDQFGISFKGHEWLDLQTFAS